MAAVTHGLNVHSPSIINKPIYTTPAVACRVTTWQLQGPLWMVDVGNSDELKEQPNWDGFGGLPPETGGDASAGRDKEGGYRWRGNAFT